MRVFSIIISLSLFSLPGVLSQSNGLLSDRAQQLGLNATWYASYPSSPISDTNEAKISLVNGWNVINFFVGNGDIQYVADPFDTTNNSTVMQVLYTQGSYAPSKGLRSGADFVANPFDQNSSVGFKEALISYKVGFPSNYNWVLAGKLPGLYGGPSGSGCDGGNQSTGSNCFSVRMMWRPGGIGEAYAYIPADSNWCNSNSGTVICNDEYGKSIGRGSFNYAAGQWTQIELYVKLNSPSKQDGVITVWANGKQAVYMDNVPYHTTNLILIESIFFSTFFGGSSPQYATPTNQYSYFKDFQMSVGSPFALTTAGSARATPRWMLVAVVGGLLGLLMVF